MPRTLYLTRVLPAPRRLVFRALTDPALIARWFGPKGYQASSVAIDLRVGGSYRLAMQPPEGPVFHIIGQFREIAPMQRLAYTFQYEEPDPDDRETVVTMSLREAADATELRVEQGSFRTDARRLLHEQGWADSVDRLRELISGEDWPPPE